MDAVNEDASATGSWAAAVEETPSVESQQEQEQHVVEHKVEEQVNDDDDDKDDAQGKTRSEVAADSSSSNEVTQAETADEAKTSEYAPTPSVEVEVVAATVDVEQQQEQEQSPQEEQLSTMARKRGEARSKKKAAPRVVDKNPTVIPRQGLFFEHDNREGDNHPSQPSELAAPEEAGTALVADKLDELTIAEPPSGVREQHDQHEPKSARERLGGQRNKPDNNRRTGGNGGGTRRGFRGKMSLEDDGDGPWTHDRFDLSEQQPKSRTDIVKSYGYDIRGEASSSSVTSTAAAPATDDGDAEPKKDQASNEVVIIHVRAIIDTTFYLLVP